MTAVLDSAEKMTDGDLEIMVYGHTETDARPKSQEAINEQRKLLGKLGFGRLVQSLRNERMRTTCHYEQLSGYELHVTMAFMPTAYRERRWDRYNFDLVPTYALKALDAAKEANRFDGYELWTPERPNPEPKQPRRLDPMFVGVIGAHHDMSRNFNWRYREIGNTDLSFHPIARWGEAVLPFENIEKRVLDNRVKLVRCCGKRMIRIVGTKDRFCLICGQTFIP